MEHISTIVQDALDRHADKVEIEFPVLAEEIRTHLERVEEDERELELA